MPNTNLNIQIKKPAVLHRYIEGFKIYHFNEDADIQLFPKGVFEIVFQSNDCFQHNTSYSSGWETRPKNFIGGLHNRSYHVKPIGKSNFCIVVEFKPNTAKYFIPYKLNDFQNNVVDVFEIWGKSGYELAQKIADENDAHKKIELIEDFLLDQYIARKESVIDQAVDWIFDSKGFVEINDLAINSSLSVAQFRKRFKEEIGISPSQYCKIIRINTTLGILEKDYYSSLTELTYKLGYFDQSHFIRDFKSVTGTSPKSFRKAI